MSTVQLLLNRRAPLDPIDDSYGGTPLSWALHAWGNEPQGSHDRYYQVVRVLVAAGATVKPQWLAHPTIQADAKMVAALRAQPPHSV